MTGNLVTVVKDGRLTNIDEDNLHKGFMVVLQTADIVPADLKLVEANGLEIDEFDITGELLPVIKQVGNEDTILYAGSKVTRGTGIGIVLAAGGQSEFGRILNQNWEQKQVYEFHVIEKKYLLLILLLLPAFVIRAAQSKNVVSLIAFYLSLSVILLLLQNNELFKFLFVSKELKELKRFGIQIRDRSILELMSQIDILCFDKTGVLTTRQMSVKNVYHAGGILDEKKTPASQHKVFHWIKIACALCHDVLIFEKLDLANPIDKALISFARKNGIVIKELLGRYKRTYDKPFDPENRYMANGYELDGKGYYFAKGDPQVILKLCNRYMTATGAWKKLDFAFLDRNLSNMQAINRSGDTVIAIAYSSGIPGNTPANYTFLGLLQLHNPLQHGARETINGITEKGIRSLLLTGDRAETAVSVAEECGITSDSTTFLLGRTIERLDLREVARQSAYCSVFARLIPTQKGLLIRVLEQKGHCIGMVGDGANDGIALHVADVGISFVKDSSPIARKFSDILIKELADLLRLIDSAERIKKRSKSLWLFRIFILVVLFVSMYGSVFISLFPVSH